MSADFQSIDELLQFERDNNVLIPRSKVETGLTIRPLISVEGEGQNVLTIRDLPPHVYIRWAYNDVYNGRGFRYSINYSCKCKQIEIIKDFSKICLLDLLIPGIPKNPTLVNGMKCDPMYFPHEIWEKHIDSVNARSKENQSMVAKFLAGETLRKGMVWDVLSSLRKLVTIL